MINKTNNCEVLYKYLVFLPDVAFLMTPKPQNDNVKMIYYWFVVSKQIPIRISVSLSFASTRLVCGMPTHIVQFAYLLGTTISWKFLMIFLNFYWPLTFFFAYEVGYSLEVLNLKYVDWRLIKWQDTKCEVLRLNLSSTLLLLTKVLHALTEHNEKTSSEKQFHRKIFCFLPRPLFFLQGKTNKEAILWQLVICLNKSKLPTASFRITQKMFKLLIIS